MSLPQVEFLKWYGYLHQAAPDVKGQDFDKLSTKDEPVVSAVKLYQEYFSQVLNQVSFAIHNREANPDGDIGPATSFLLNMPRCFHPDFPVPPEDSPEAAKLWSAQEANWPDACRNDLHTGRNFDSLPGMTKEDTDGIWWAACHNWTESISDLKLSPTDSQSEADFWAGKERMSGGTLAWSYLARNRCDVRLSQAYNSRVNWNRRLAAAVKTHEDGHALGLNHQRDSAATMYPSITNTSMGRYGYPNATDIKAMERLGYHPHSDWKTRQLPESKLFLPRGADDPTPPPLPDLAERVKDLEAKAFEGLVADAAQDARLEWLTKRVETLENKS